MYYNTFIYLVGNHRNLCTYQCFTINITSSKLNITEVSRNSGYYKINYIQARISHL